MITHTNHNKLMEFARLIANGQHSFKAASEVLGEGSTSEALVVHEVWRNDPIVMAEVKRLREEAGDDTGMSKAEFLGKLKDEIDNCKDARAKVSLLVLYAEIKGFTGKNAQVQVNNVTNKVMIVQNKGSDKDWSVGLREQQQRLTQNV